MTISESSTQIYCRQPINFASCSSPRPNLMDLMGKNFQYIKHPKNVYAKFHTYLFVEFLCHINEYFKVLFQLILLVAQYKYDRHFMSHLVIKSKVHYAVNATYKLKHVIIEFNLNYVSFLSPFQEHRVNICFYIYVFHSYLFISFNF